MNLPPLYPILLILTANLAYDSSSVIADSLLTFFTEDDSLEMTFVETLAADLNLLSGYNSSSASTFL